MAGVETIGGCCPKCLSSMLQKWESSHSGFMFDACVWCGFLYYSSENEFKEEEISDVWNMILEQYDTSSRAELVRKWDIQQYYKKEESEFYPSIFVYNDIEDVHLVYKIRQAGIDCDGFRVYWSEQTEEQGTIQSIDEQTVFILWDGDTNALPYPLLSIGVDIHFVEEIEWN